MVAMLVDRGHLSYSARVCSIWSQFCSTADGEDAPLDNRRSELTVEHLMRHRAGLQGFTPPATLAQALDTDFLAKQVRVLYVCVCVCVCVVVVVHTL